MYHRHLTGMALALALGTLFCGTDAFAQARTTPVEVKKPVQIDTTANTVKVDPANNTVKAAQSGTWSVGVTGTPTVQIDPLTISTVTTQTKSKMIRIWSTNKVIAANTTDFPSSFNCTGFKEIRVVMRSSLISSDVKCGIGFSGPGNLSISMGEFSFGVPNPPFSTQASFSQSTQLLIFTFPVLSDNAYLYVANRSAYSTTMFCDESWVYLVN